MADNNLLAGWTEKYGSATEQFDILTGTGRATRIFQGPWHSRFLFLNNMLPLITSANSGGLVINLTPYRYPDIPDLFANSVEIRGILSPDNVGTSKQIGYDLAEITIHYGIDSTTMGFGQSGRIERPSYSVECNAELLRLPGRFVRDKNGRPQHDKPDFFFPLHRSQIKVSLKNLNISFIPSSGISKINGHSVEFLGTNSPFAAYTLRFDGVNVESASIISELTRVATPPGGGDSAFNNDTKLILVYKIRYNATYNFTYNPTRWDRKLIGIEPEIIGQANNLPVRKIYQEISIYESDDNFYLIIPDIMI